MIHPPETPISFRWQRYGSDGLMAYVEGDECAVRRQMTDAVRRLEVLSHPMVVEWLIGFNSILFLLNQSICAETQSSLVCELEKSLLANSANAKDSWRLHRIAVLYDGPDLDSVAQQTGLSAEAIIAIHTAPTYTVALLGFTPGFPYLYPLDPRLQLPRLQRPRTRVPAGSVAIGGEHAGIYSIASPGGWHLLGRTSTCLFDPANASDPFLFRPGDKVRFCAAKQLLPKQSAISRADSVNGASA
jgi:KipI family sensor histidine kinase inhibitor